jgi:hypothetical protein
MQQVVQGKYRYLEIGYACRAERRRNVGNLPLENRRTTVSRKLMPVSGSNPKCWRNFSEQTCAGKYILNIRAHDSPMKRQRLGNKKTRMRGFLRVQ